MAMDNKSSSGCLIHGGAMFQSIGKVIERKNTDSGLAQSLTAAIVLARINEQGNGRWQATQFRKGRLTLTAPSPIEAQELKLRQLVILAEINSLFNETLVKQLIVRS